MSFTDLGVKAIYTGTGAAVDFAIPFDFIDDTSIKVKLRVEATGVETLKSLTTHYTLTNSPPTLVHMLIAPAIGESLCVYRESVKTQPDIYAVGAFPYVAIDARFDKITHMVQEVSEVTDRCVKNKIAQSTSLVTELPLPVANKLLGWNAGATAIENKDTIDIATMQTDITNLKNADIALTAVDVANAAADLILNTRVGATEVTLALHTINLASLNANYAGYGVRIGNIEALLPTLTYDAATPIGILQADVVTLKSQVLALQGADVSQVASINSLIARMNAVETVLYGISKRLAGSMVIANNNAVPTNVVGTVTGTTLNLNSSGAKSAEVYVEIERVTNLKHIFTSGKLIMHLIGTVWYIIRDTTTSINGIRADDDSADGITFTVATTEPLSGIYVGQVQYITDNMAGTGYTGNVRWLMQEMSRSF